MQLAQPNRTADIGKQGADITQTSKYMGAEMSKQTYHSVFNPFEQCTVTERKSTEMRQVMSVHLQLCCTY
jgi:hypothetical protein